jgi:hypothetical protein
MKIFKGSCHCGDIRFELEADINSVRVCNCSICTKRGALIFRVEKEKFRMISSIEKLKVYEWHTKTAKDYFCKTCGILPFRIPSALSKKEVEEGVKPFHGWAINARCLEGLDLDSLKVVRINGLELD